MKNFQNFIIGLCDRQQKVAVVCDEFLYPSLQTVIADLPVFLIESKEENKSRKKKEEMENFLFSHRLFRTDTVVAIGGGIVSDLVGFVAATYKRGVMYVSVPTTLVAMVDASVGGKCGINTEYGKNTLGCFYAPKETLIDPTFLTTLPLREVRSGMMEMYKIALLFSRDLYRQLRDVYDIPTLSMIEQARALKKAVCEEDFLDQGKRATLNFGHTLGHALEIVTSYQISHGDGVKWGMIFSLCISRFYGWLDDDFLYGVAHELLRWGWGDFPEDTFLDEIWKVMLHDKKRSREDCVSFVVLKEPFTPFYEKGNWLLHLSYDHFTMIWKKFMKYFYVDSCTKRL